jgi:hypothetical protein
MLQQPWLKREETQKVSNTYMEFLARDPETPGSVPGATRFSDSSETGTGSTEPGEDNWGSNSIRKSNRSGLLNGNNESEDQLCWPRNTLLNANFNTNFADKSR